MCEADRSSSGPQVRRLREFPRPRVLLSRCIEFDACRYNGEMIRSRAVSSLKAFAELIPVCPEVEIGLGVPRDPLRLILAEGSERLLQPSTHRDLTDPMLEFAAGFADKTEAIDGIVMKAGSPSCGPRGVDIYPDATASVPVSKGSGLFAKAILKSYPGTPLADERELENPAFCDHFFTRLFVIADFMQVRRHESGRNLLQFHAENKYILNAFSRREYRELTRLVVNREGRPFDEVVREYEQRLRVVLARRLLRSSHVAILERAAVHLFAHAAEEDQAEIGRTIESYRASTIVLEEARQRFRDWIERFDESYLAHQTYFEPYPECLLPVRNR